MFLFILLSFILIDQGFGTEIELQSDGQHPQVGFLPDNTFILVWLRGSDLYGQWFNNESLPISSESMIDSDVDTPAKIISLSNQVIVAYRQGFNMKTFIGDPFSNITDIVNVFIVRDYYDFDLTNLVGDDWVIVWRDDFDEIRLKLFGSNARTFSWDLEITAFDQLTVTGDDVGNFIVSYTDLAGIIFIQRYDPEGYKYGLRQNIVSGHLPQIESYNDGYFILHWRQGGMSCSRHYGPNLTPNPLTEPSCLNVESSQLVLNPNGGNQLITFGLVNHSSNQYIRILDQNETFIDEFQVNSITQVNQSRVVIRPDYYGMVVWVHNNTIYRTEFSPTSRLQPLPSRSQESETSSFQVSDPNRNSSASVRSSSTVDSSASVRSSSTVGSSERVRSSSTDGSSERARSSSTVDSSERVRSSSTVGSGIRVDDSIVSESQEIMDINIKVDVIYQTDFGSYELISLDDGVGIIHLEISDIPSDDRITLFTYAEGASQTDYVIQGDTECVYLDGEYYRVRGESDDDSYDLIFELDDCESIDGWKLIPTLTMLCM